jgi:hypothetical protein
LNLDSPSSGTATKHFFPPNKIPCLGLDLSNFQGLGPEWHFQQESGKNVVIQSTILTARNSEDADPQECQKMLDHLESTGMEDGRWKMEDGRVTVSEPDI